MERTLRCALHSHRMRPRHHHPRAEGMKRLMGDRRMGMGYRGEPAREMAASGTGPSTRAALEGHRGTVEARGGGHAGEARPRMPDGGGAAEDGDAVMGRAVQAFLPMGRVPTVTHNDLEPYVGRDGRARLRKSERLRRAEDAYMAALAPIAPAEPLAGPVSAEVRWCFPTGGRHAQGEPRDSFPDLDNMEKTFLDCCERAGIVADDRLIVRKETAKMWRDPSGVWLRFEEIGAR